MMAGVTERVRIDEVVAVARHRWPSILHQFNIVVPANNKHGPCPVCGGKDRFRFDDREGRGTWFCNQCEPHAGDGLDLLAKAMKVSVSEAAHWLATLLPITAVVPVENMSVEPDIATAVKELLSHCQYQTSPYLLKKQLDDRVQVLGDTSRADSGYPSGTTVFTLVNVDGTLTGAQVIAPDGQKRFLKHSRLAGAFVVVRHDDRIQPETIIIAEGVATALAICRFATGSVFAALSATNMVNVATALKAKYPQANFILAGDNDADGQRKDNPGRHYAEKAAAAVGRNVALPPTSEKMDWDDYRRRVGDEAAGQAFRECCNPAREDAPSQTPKKTQTETETCLATRSRLKIRQGSAGYDRMQDFLIKGYLPHSAVTCIYGPSGSYKSFLAVSMACHVATGKPWAGQKVAQCAVLYIAGEGSIGVSRRIRAWEHRYHGGKPVQNLFRIDEAVYPASSSSLHQILKAMEDIEAHCGQRIGLIIIDTLARCFAGNDENTAKDMGAFIQGCDMIKTRNGATLLIVHHSGKDKDRGARGSSALRAALDAEYRISREDDAGTPSLTMYCTKMKDAEEPAPIRFELAKVAVTVDKDNETVSSLVLMDTGHYDESKTDRPQNVPRLTINHQAVRECISAITQEHDVCTRATLKERLCARGIDANKSLSHWLGKLERERLIVLDGEHVKLTETAG